MSALLWAQDTDELCRWYCCSTCWRCLFILMALLAEAKSHLETVRKSLTFLSPLEQPLILEQQWEYPLLDPISCTIFNTDSMSPFETHYCNQGFRECSPTITLSLHTSHLRMKHKCPLHCAPNHVSLEFFQRISLVWARDGCTNPNTALDIFPILENSD